MTGTNCVKLVRLGRDITHLLIIFNVIYLFVYVRFVHGFIVHLFYSESPKVLFPVGMTLEMFAL